MRPCLKMGAIWRGLFCRMSQKRGFLFPEKSFSRFRGVQPCCRMSQKWGFLFPEKSFSRFRGVQPCCRMSQKRGFLFPENSFRVFGGWGWGASILNGVELRHPFCIQVPHDFVLLRQLECTAHVVLRLQLLRPSQIGFCIGVIKCPTIHVS